MSLPVRVRLQRLLPQRLLCRLIFVVSRSRLRWVKSPLIAWFARHYRVDMSEAATPDLGAYPTFNAFFTRRLRAGARTIDPDPGAVVSPVDGRLMEFGTIRDARLIQAKGLEYGLDELLGESSDDTARFRDGEFATIYLSPRDYHRVHMPVAGRLSRVRYVAGSRFSVNAATASGIERLFCRNERLIAWFETRHGRLAIVLVGALNVSSISTVEHGEIESGRDREWAGIDSPPLEKGAEFGRFNLGSTVILLFERDVIDWSAALADGTPVRLGARLATIRRDSTG